MTGEKLVRKLTIFIVITVLGVLLLSWQSSAQPAHFSANYSYLRFEVSTFLDLDWIASELVTLERAHQGEDVLKVKAQDLPEELANQVFLSVNGGTPEPLGQAWIVAVPNSVSYSEIQVLLKPEIILAKPGTYSFSLEPHGNKMSPIQIEIEIQPYSTVLGITPCTLAVTATSGPGRYLADDKATLQVQSNNSNWDVLLATAGLNFNDDPELKVDPGDLVVAINDPDGEYQPLEEYGSYAPQGIILHPAAFMGGTATLYFAADLNWQHRAGSYTGVINVTLSSR